MTPIETKKNIHTNCLLFLFGHDRIACLNVSYQKGCGRQKGTSMQLRLPTREHFEKLVKKIAMFLFNPRLLLCFFLAWMITNGWCYLFIFFGQLFDLTWMTVAGSVWVGVLQDGADEQTESERKNSTTSAKKKKKNKKKSNPHRKIKQKQTSLIKTNRQQPTRLHPKTKKP